MTQTVQFFKYAQMPTDNN